MQHFIDPNTQEAYGFEDDVNVELFKPHLVNTKIQRPSQHHDWVDGAWALARSADRLAEAKQIKIEELKLEFDAALDADVTYNGNVFQGDARARENLRDAIVHRQAGGALPAGFKWRALDNKGVPFTDADVDGLILTMGDNKLSAVANLHTKKDAVISATSLSAINDVAW